MASMDRVGSKRLVVGASYGLRDWMAQRATAIVMALYTVVLVMAVLLSPGTGYEAWAGVFAAQWMKVLTFVAFLAIFYHAWVGMRDIWMDYVTHAGLRFGLHILTIVWLLGCAGYAAQVIWRV